MINNEKLAEPISKEYQRWVEMIGDDDPYDGRNTIGIHDVLKAHFLLANYFYFNGGEGIAVLGPRSIDLFHSTLNRQFVSLNGVMKWTNPLDLVSTLFFGLVKNHPFHDANKRTALLTALYHLQRIGRCPDVPERDLEKFTVAVASNEIEKARRYKELVKRKEADPRIKYISYFFKSSTRKVDKAMYLVTYQQLNGILRRFGYYLDNPKNNFIDILTDREEKNIFGKRKQKTIKVGQIGFPGWTKQVNQGAIKTVKQVTGLTAEKGYDSQTLFKGADPMNSLIDMYHGPLKRLADK